MVIRLGDACTKIGSGATPKGGKAGYLDSGPFTLVRSQNVHNHGFEHGGLAFISEEQASKLDGVAVFPRDVLLNITGDSVARVCQAPEDLGPARVNQHVAIIRPAPAVLDPQFLRYYLVNAPVQEHMLALASVGATRPALTRSMIEGFEIEAPEIEGQREIASILGALDDKIELNRRMAATLEEVARALYRSWFVDFDPVKAKAEGLAPAFMDETTAALFPDRFGDDGLPEGWETQVLLDQSDWVNGAAFKNMHFSDALDALPVIKIAELKAGITGNTKFTATDLGKKFKITRGELLFSWSGNPDTSIDAFIWPLGEAWLNQHIFAVRPNGHMSKAMLFTCLRSFKPEMAEIARNKQTTGLGHITRKDLEAFPVSVAPAPVVSAFDERIFPIFHRYCECLFENQSLKELRDTLLPKLMSGELRVGEACEQLETVA